MCFKICYAILLIVSSAQAFEHFGLSYMQNKSDTGEPCEWEGKNGTCINFWNCLTNAIDARHEKHPPVCKIENGEVTACCTSCQVVSNISSIIIVNKLGMMLKRTGKKSTDKCMEYMNIGWYSCFRDFAPGKVEKDYDDEAQCFNFFIAHWLAAGGKEAFREEFPHMALLGYGESESSADWLCGGTIISKRYILTAAHCRSTPQLGEVKYVALGILKRSDPRELWQVYEVDRFIPHPDYRPLSKYHDIALIKTKKRIIFGDAVLPACLPAGTDDTEKGIATGWGALGHRQRNADVLQKVELSRFNKDECSVHYKPHRNLASGYNHTTQMCYGDTDIGRDTCEALLGYGESESSADWLCGGTIISKRYILTAAHCRSTPQLGEVKYVALGILKRSDPRELWQVYEVDRFIPHPDYRPLSKYHDIALIKTKKRIIFGDAVLPACLPAGTDDTEKGIATGWGALGHRQRNADVLQKVELSRFNKDECSVHYKPHRNLASGYNHTTQMCYGDTDIGRDTCEGDSGGPLLAHNSCPPVVLGVTSSGHPCGFPGGAGLYTRVEYYVQWIENIVWP